MQYDATLATPRSTPAIAQYEMAFRMQTSVPEVTDCRERAGARLRPVRPRRPASRARFAANCLLARRLAERGVRFIQLYHRGWDHHGDLPGGHPPASATRRDQACCGADHRT